MATMGMKSRVASLVFVVPALLVVSLAICAPPARARSWGELVLHSFDGTDGSDPLARLIRGSDGNFYGTTAGGDGMVFQLTPSGTLTTLYQFCSVFDPSTDNCTDGANPFGGVIQGRDSNFYGTTIAGGTNFWGNVFQLTPSGTLTILYSFCNVLDPSMKVCTDGANPDAGVIQGSDGNFYGTTYLGGAIGGGTAYRLTPSGTLTILYSFCSKTNCLDGAFPYAGVVQRSDGNFYGTTTSGGPNNGGTVFKLTPSGALTTLHSFCSKTNCSDGQYPYGGLIQGHDGNFYGTTLIGGKNEQGTVFKITPSGRLTTLHSFTGGTDGESPFAGLVQGAATATSMAPLSEAVQNRPAHYSRSRLPARSPPFTHSAAKPSAPMVSLLTAAWSKVAAASFMAPPPAVRMAMAQSSKWARRYGGGTYPNAGTHPGGAEGP